MSLVPKGLEAAPDEAEQLGMGEECRAAARVFSVLSQVGRLAVFRRVLAAGPQGVQSEHLGYELKLTGSALTLHLKTLERAGLIEIRLERRNDRSLNRLAVCIASVERLSQIMTWLDDAASIRRSEPRMPAIPDPRRARSRD